MIKNYLFSKSSLFEIYDPILMTNNKDRIEAFQDKIKELLADSEYSSNPKIRDRLEAIIDTFAEKLKYL